MKNSHKFWLIILIPLIIYLCFASKVVLTCVLVVNFIMGFVYFYALINNELIWFLDNDKAAKYLAILNPICWILLAIAYFNKWMDNELH